MNYWNGVAQDVIGWQSLLKLVLDQDTAGTF